MLICIQRFGCFMENLSTEEFHSLKELDLIDGSSGGSGDGGDGAAAATR